MGRAPCCSKVGLHRGPWTATEDALLVNYIQAHGQGQWRSLPNKAGLLRCGKSCRLRWMNYLRPDIKRGNITREEDDLIIRLHSLLGNRWSLIAGRLPGRTDNEIKNYWNTHLSKRLRTHGTDPNTHKTLSHVDQAKQFTTKKSSSKKRSDGSSSINKLGKMHKNNSNNNNEVDKRKGVIMEDSNNTNVERERTKVNLPKPVRVTSVISLASNNHSNGRFNIASSFNSSTQNNVAFDQSEKDGILEIPWLPVPNNDNLMMMGACGADVDLDIIQNHYYYYYYHHHHHNYTPDDKNQQLEKLYEEYLKLIEADDDHNRSNDSDLYYNNNDGDVAPLDTFTQS